MEQLCEENFWFDSCKNTSCPKHHIRRIGDKLILFDCLAHLNRLNRRIKNLNTMKMPVNCDLYINDCVIDPLDYIQPIKFTNPNIHVIRSYGIHPNTTAPKAFFTRLQGHLNNMSERDTLAGCGPFSAQSNDSDKTPNFFDFLTRCSTFNSRQKHPTHISSSPKDINLTNKMPNDTIIIWQNLNNNSADYFANFCRDILPKNELFYTTINGKCLEYKYANKISRQLKNKEIMDRILLGTSSPHYAGNYCSSSMSQPLQIANIILEIHQYIKKINCYSHFTLADTNDYFTSKSFSIYPKTMFDRLNSVLIENLNKKILSATLDEYKSLIKFNDNKKINTTAMSQCSNISKITISPLESSSNCNEKKIMENESDDHRPVKRAKLDTVDNQVTKTSSQSTTTINNDNKRANLIRNKAYELINSQKKSSNNSIWTKIKSDFGFHSQAIPFELIKQLTTDLAFVPDKDLPEALSKIQ